LLEAHGIVTKDKKLLADGLKPKQCPNCTEPNKPDSKFCVKCRIVLTYDAYSETIEEKQRDMRTIRDEIKEEVKKQLAPLITQIKPEILKQWLV
jgi:hypothetical protein